jgi:hypothetical protein
MILEKKKVVEKIKTHVMFSNFFPKIVPLMRCEKCCRARQATSDNIIKRMRFRHLTTKATHMHWEYIILLFHSNGSFKNAPQCYVIRTLPVLFSLVAINDSCLKHFGQAREISCRDTPWTYSQTLMNDFNVNVTNICVEFYISSHVKLLFILEFKLCFRGFVTLMYVRRLWHTVVWWWIVIEGSFYSVCTPAKIIKAVKFINDLLNLCMGVCH